MKLFIVRHGETPANEKDIVCGWYNSHINKKGKVQADKLASRLSNEKIDIVFCSDLNRCKQTLKPIIKGRNIPVHYTKLLREQNYGVFEKRPLSELIKWFNKNPSKLPDGFESKEKLKERISIFVKKNLLNLSGKNILIVTHGRAKRTLLEVLFSNSENDKERIKQTASNTALTIINFEDNQNPILELLNCDKHLK